MSDPLPNGAMAGATSYHDVCLDGPSPKAKGMTECVTSIRMLYLCQAQESDDGALPLAWGWAGPVIDIGLSHTWCHQS